MSKSNISPIVAHARDFLSGSDKAEGGLVAMALDTVGLLDAIYSCPIEGSESRDVFTTADLVLNKPKNGDGTDSKNGQGARRAAWLCDNFNYEFASEVPSRLSVQVDRLVPQAIALRHYYGDDKGGLSIKLVKERGDVRDGHRYVLGKVPAGDMFELVDDGGKPNARARKARDAFAELFEDKVRREPRNDEELYEFMLAYPVSANGRVSIKFGGATALTSSQFLKRLVERARADGVLPPKAASAVKMPTDKGSTFSASVADVLKGLDMILETDESDVALTKQLEGQCDLLASKWAAYRVLYPAGRGQADLPL